MRKVLSVLAFAFAFASGSGLAQGPAAPAGPAPSTVLLGPGFERLPPTAPIQACPEPPSAIAAEPRGEAERFWLRGEYLLWWTKGSQLPPLITSGLPGTTPLPGALGQTGSSVLFGNSDVDRGPRSGGASPPGSGAIRAGRSASKAATSSSVPATPASTRLPTPRSAPR